MAHTVLIEAMFSGGEGSERGIAESWIEAVVQMPEVDKVIILTSCDRGIINSKEQVVCIAPAKVAWQVIFRFCYGLRLYGFARLFYGLYYLHWLRESSRQANMLARACHIDLAVHVGFSSLWFGSQLASLKQTGTRIVVCGNLPVPPPANLRPFAALTDALLESTAVHVCRILSPLASSDVIACATTGTLFLVRPAFPNVICELCPEAARPLVLQKQVERLERVLYFDQALVLRKGRKLLLAALRLNGQRSPVPLRVFSSKPDDWKCFENVEVSGKVSELEFFEELARSRFVLCTSLREGLNTTVCKGATVGVIPIVTDLSGFESLNDDSCIRLDSRTEAISELLRCLKRANDMSIEDKLVLSENAKKWGESMTDKSRLQECIRRWLKP
ncbi:MAG: hypothetical protein K2W95_28165 [Candidatus Obscuribacterales bacterium]|nr:hypothetical protein [Candidatus Obscuribacterales bacterium]